MRHRILVVDDDQAIQQLLKTVLVRAGFQVEAASDGEGALATIAQSECCFSAVILDLMMPRINGFEVITQLQKSHPQLLRRIIILTAAGQKTLQDFDSHSVCGVINKPFELEHLVRAVRTCAELPESATVAS